MTILRRLGLGLSALLFLFCLGALAALAGLYAIFNTPRPLETALQSSGIYSDITPSILEQQEITPLPLSDPDVQKALEQALPAEFYQDSSEKIIDGTYKWVHGATKTPEFSIDIGTVKANFADNIAAYVRRKLGDLPACTKVVEPPVSFEGVMAMSCMPPYVTPTSIADTVRREALKSTLFFDGTTLTATTMKDGQGKTFTQQMAFLPKAYHYYLISLATLPLLIVFLALAVIFLSRTRKAGVKRVAWICLVVGATGAVLTAVCVELTDISARVFGLPLPVPTDFQDKTLAVIETLANSAKPWWFGFFAGYATIAIVLFVAIRLARPKPSLKFSDAEEPQYEEIPDK